MYVDFPKNRPLIGEFGPTFRVMRSLVGVVCRHDKVERIPDYVNAGSKVLIYGFVRGIHQHDNVF